MRFSISDMSEGESLPLEFTHTLALSKKYGVSGDTAVLSFSGAVLHRKDYFEVTGNVMAVFASECAKCLELVDVSLEYPFDERFAESLEVSGDEDAFEYFDKTLDLSQALFTTFLIELPARVLCKDDCLGLCMKCHANLNNTACNCPPDGDDRFSILDSLNI